MSYNKSTITTESQVINIKTTVKSLQNINNTINHAQEQKSPRNIKESPRKNKNFQPINIEVFGNIEEYSINTPRKLNVNKNQSNSTSGDSSISDEEYSYEFNNNVLLSEVLNDVINDGHFNSGRTTNADKMFNSY